MSCLVEKLKYYIALSDAERDLLNTLEEDIESYKRNETVFQQDAIIEHLYVVKSGWLASYAYLNDGGRLILNLHYPGDIIGAMFLPFERSAAGLIALTPCELCPFPQSGIRNIFAKSSRLSALIFAIGMQDNVVLLDRLKAVGRMSGEDRLGLFLLQIHARLSVTNPDITDTFDLPVSQEVIGDALGITPVYVNRMLKQLQKDGFISYDKPTISLLRKDALIKRCDFKNRYYALDTSWYPEQTV